MAGAPDYEAVMERASRAFLEWRMIPAPQRGEILRLSRQIVIHQMDRLAASEVSFRRTHDCRRQAV